MIRLLERNEIDTQLWDHCISSSPNGTIYNLSWYLDHVSSGWCALVEDDYSAVMPLPFKKKLGIQMVYQPFFSRQCGIFDQENNSDKIPLFLKNIPDRFKKIHFCLDHLDKLKVSPEYEAAEWQYQKLYFDTTHEETRKKFSSNAKRLLKKSVENKLVFTFSDDVQSLLKFFRALKGNDLKDLTSEHYLRLQSLMLTGLQNGSGKVAEVWFNKRMVASAYFWWYKKEVVYLKGTSGEEGRKAGAMYFLFDEIIKHSHTDCNALDFGGSRIPSIASFFHRLGGEDKLYTCLCKDNSPAWFRLGNSIRKSLKSYPK